MAEGAAGGSARARRRRRRRRVGVVDRSAGLGTGVLFASVRSGLEWVSARKQSRTSVRPSALRRAGTGARRAGRRCDQHPQV